MSGAGKCFDCQRPGLELVGALCRDCRRDREVYGRDNLGLSELVTCEECQGLEALCNECGGYGVVVVGAAEYRLEGAAAIEVVLDNRHPEQRAAAHRLLEDDDDGALDGPA